MLMVRVRLDYNAERISDWLEAKQTIRESTCKGPGHAGVLCGSLRTFHPFAVVARVPNVGKRTYCYDCIVEMKSTDESGDTRKETT